VRTWNTPHVAGASPMPEHEHELTERERDAYAKIDELHMESRHRINSLCGTINRLQEAALEVTIRLERAQRTRWLFFYGGLACGLVLGAVSVWVRWTGGGP